MSASAFVRQLQSRSARMAAMNDARRVFVEVLRRRFGNEAYAYQAGFFEAQLFSLAADRKDSTDDLVAALLKAAKRLDEEKVAA